MHMNAYLDFFPLEHLLTHNFRVGTGTNVRGFTACKTSKQANKQKALIRAVRIVDLTCLNLFKSYKRDKLEIKYPK